VGRPDNPADRTQYRGRADDSLADHGVLAHECPLGLTERARSMEDLVGTAIFPMSWSIAARRSSSIDASLSASA
jgi:hypothetical protein